MKLMTGLVAMLLAATSFAPASAAESGSWEDVGADDFVVVPYPAKGTPEYDRDYAILLEDQNRPRDAECRLADLQSSPDFNSLFTPSGLLDDAEMKRVGPLFARIGKVIANVTATFKNRFARPRPMYAEPDLGIQPCIPTPTAKQSYPSTHATSGAADACVLSEIFPERSDALQEWGRKIGEIRVIAGVHHPSDIEAGSRLGWELCRRLFSFPGFRKEVETLRVTPHP